MKGKSEAIIAAHRVNVLLDNLYHLLTHEASLVPLRSERIALSPADKSLGH